MFCKVLVNKSKKNTLQNILTIHKGYFRDNMRETQIPSLEINLRIKARINMVDLALTVLFTVICIYLITNDSEKLLKYFESFDFELITQLLWTARLLFNPKSTRRINR